jgi:hypothetical protein
MTDRTQFEAMLEALINEDQETAKEIFHNIVVAKSREIYEELLAEDFDLEESNPDDEIPVEPEESTEEGFPSDEEGDEEEPADDEEGDEEGDATDDFAADDEEGDAEGGDMEDRVMDLEDALDELKAEFEELMAGEGDDDMDAMGDMEPMGDMDAMGDMDSELENEEFFEYVNKVALPKHGDNGANTRSTVAKPNNMGGTTANIAKSFSTTSGGTEGGLAKPTAKVDNAGNVNVPGAKAGKSGFKKSEPGHGAEKKGSREQADNKKSIVGGK